MIQCVHHICVIGGPKLGAQAEYGITKGRFISNGQVSCKYTRNTCPSGDHTMNDCFLHLVVFCRADTVDTLPNCSVPGNACII